MNVRSGKEEDRIRQGVNGCVGEWSLTEFVTESVRTIRGGWGKMSGRAIDQQMELWANEKERLNGGQVSGHHCVRFCVREFKRLIALPLSSTKRRWVSYITLKSATPFLSDKRKWFLAFLEVSVCSNVSYALPLHSLDCKWPC
jgi:hypothetical protein